MTGRVRPARPEDARTILEVRIAAWRAAYADLMPAAYLAALDADLDGQVARLAERLQAPPYTSLVGLDGSGAVVGMCACGPGREGDREAGELYALNVHPESWGSGVGPALLAAAEAALTTYASSYLWVVEGNARARRFYERAGWCADGGRKVDDAFGTGAIEVRYSRKA